MTPRAVVMKKSRHWRAGTLLVLVLLGVGQASTLRAQTPGPGISPSWDVSRSGADVSTGAGSLEPVANPGLPASRSGVSRIQRQGDLLRLVRDVPGDAKPIVLEADQISTWDDQGYKVFLLQGQVLAQQSVVQVRCDQAIAWVDWPRYQKTGILHVDLYAEGRVRLDTSVEVQDGSRAVLELNTRGEFRVRGSRGKVQNQVRSSEPIAQRAKSLNLGPRLVQGTPSKPSAATIQPVSSTTSSASMLPPVPGGGSALPPIPGSGSALPPIPGGAGLPPDPELEIPPPPIPPPPVPPSPIQPTGGVVPPSGAVQQTSFQALKSGSRNPASAGVERAQSADSEDPVSGARTTPLPVPSPSPSQDGFGPPGSLPSPGQTFPAPMPSRIPPIPPPPSQEQPPRSSNKQPDPEPPGSASPAPSLPAPTPGFPTPSSPLPLPPPSRVEEPARPGELPKASTPGRPLIYQISPRSGGEGHQVKVDQLPGGRKMITVTGGLILNVRNAPKVGIIDVEADRAVIWIKQGDKAEETLNNLRSEQGETSKELEFYMAGHVVLRSKLNPRDKTDLIAEELYYDTSRNVAVALDSRLELRTDRVTNVRQGRIEEPIILQAPELLRTGPNTYEVTDARIFSSKLPSDPGLELLVAKATLTNRERPRTFFGQPVMDKQGKPIVIQESIIEAKNVFIELEGVPIFYSPYIITDARDPLGPLETINLGGNRVLGFQAGVGLNVYKLFGVEPIDGTRWRFLVDYLSRRGPALGTNYNYNGVFESLVDENDPWGTKPCFEGLVRAYGIYDQATDILGGSRPPDTLTFDPPGYRGRTLWRQGVFNLPYGFDVLAQMSLLSDRNFLEQYFKREFDSDPNQANFLYVKQQQDNWAWSLLGSVRTSNWITTTQWWPRGDAYWLGQDFFDLITSNTQVSLAYASLRLSSDPPLPLQGAPNPPGYPEAFFPTDRNNSTARFAWLQEFSLPLDLGAIHFTPYVKGALVEYTNTLDGNEIGRAWGGFGARASLPLSRLYPEAESELFNIKGIHHKMVLSGNYFYARANEPFTKFAQLDRLNDDATAEMLRDFTPYQPVYNGAAGVALATSPYFNSQTYAIRRLVDNRIDTLDDIQVLQLDLRQRWQTKRGFPGFEHIIDWMTLDTSLSYFPQPDQNFGKPFSFLEYQYVWNLGDRTAFESTGWYDPQEDGARVFTVGAFFNRPDRTTYYVGYRQIDPLQSRLMMASVTYVFSPKYAMTAATSYDFGTNEAQTNTLIFTRTGTDLQVSLGFSYNSLQNNFGAIVEIVPSLVPLSRRPGGAVASMMNNR